MSLTKASFSMVDGAMLNVLDYGADPTGATDSTSAITAGITACSAAGKSLYFPSGRYKLDIAAIATSNVSLVGEKMPVLNSAETALESGSIIVGTLKLTGRNIHISNLGIDHGVAEFPSTAGNALSVSYAAGPSGGSNRGGSCRLENVIGLGRDPEDAFHAILVEGYVNCDITGCVGINNYYNLAVKVQRSNILNFIGKYAGVDSVIVKADTQFGDCDYVNLSNLSLLGTADLSNLVRIRSQDAQIERVNISNLVGSGAAVGNGIYVDVDGTTGVAINELNISNVAISNVSTGMLISSGAGTVYSTNISNSSFVNLAARVLYVTGANQNSIRLDGVYGSITSGSPNVADAILIDSSVDSFSMDNVDLVVAYSTTNLAGITLNNGYLNNWIGKGKFQITGAGIPRYGFSEPTITGTNQTITPYWDGRNNESFVRALPDAGATVNTFFREMPNGTRFPRAYRLTIVNDSVNALVIKHNPAGNIFNRGSVDFTLNSNEAVTYVFSSAIWHMTS